MGDASDGSAAVTEPVRKRFISADELLRDSFQLAHRVWIGDWRPDSLLALWRGGALPGMAIHEYFAHRGVILRHGIAKAQSYEGIARPSKTLSLTMPEDWHEEFRACARLLLVDDVFDTGRTFCAVRRCIKQRLPHIDLRIATPWSRPANNQTNMAPNYCLRQTRDWLVFPHELCGLDAAELRSGKPELREENGSAFFGLDGK
ncbi:MAG: phosphoribosyltransferase [Candidatus Eutrophobiaceae bacterium]